MTGIVEKQTRAQTSHFLQSLHMMTQPQFVTLSVAALLINTLFYSSAEKVYCVTPNGTSCSSCPHNSIHCATLSEYAQEAELHFTSNVTMVFLAGDHILDTNVAVTNVSRLTMHGVFSSDSIATVVHKGSAGFSFTNIMDFNIYSLAFTFYNKSWSYDSHQARNSALLLQFTVYAKLVNCSFNDNLGTGLMVRNTSIILADNKFIHNQGVCGTFSEKCELGCGITAFNSNLIFTGKTTFLENYGSDTASAGAIWASASSLHFTGTNHFIGNSAWDGGAIHAEANTALSFDGTSIFTHNSAHNGGAIYTSGHVVLIFNGTNNFLNNVAHSDGGAIHASYNAVTKFIGISTFSHNSANSEGGAIYTKSSVVLTFNGTTNFTENSANYGNGGAILTRYNAMVTFTGINHFFNNSADYFGQGGVIFAVNNMQLSFTGTCVFTHNSACSGGAIYAVNNIVLTFTGTKIFINNLSNSNGGAITAKKNALLTFNGTSHFSHNLAHNRGGAMYAYNNVVLTFRGTNNFINNTSFNGGAVYAEFNISSSFSGTSSFSNNSAVRGGAIFADDDSMLTFNKSINFTNNGDYIHKDSRGGAMYLYGSSNFSILSNTTVCWKNNHATLGGAIYVLNVNPLVYCTQNVNPLVYCTQIAMCTQREKCFIQLPSLNPFSCIQLVFKNNSADAAGSAIYGGALDNCRHAFTMQGYRFSEVLVVEYQADKTTSIISSDPFHICLCENNLPDCSEVTQTLSVYPGETFQVSVVTVGQGNGIVPAAVKSNMDEGRLLNSQYIQRTTKKCTILNYTVFSQWTLSKLELYADGPCSTFGDKFTFRLNVNQTCPPGFNISREETACVCDEALQKYTNHCSITNGLGKIKRESGDRFWIGYDQSYGLTVHPHCPLDYCVNDTVVFPLNNTDIQCANNRSGLLCGACNRRGHSLVLGTSRCKQCTNSHLLLLIPFALMGVALVFLLLVCKLTVATGTLSGLVFYANIVGANHALFLPVGSTDAFSVFIAWLNLDFGIETCFYDGMDAYSKTWLQFVFPVYIWVLVGLLILISNYSRKFASLLGNNPVSVLATLILLSYAKVLRTFITAVSFIDLHYQYHYNKRVWLYDANVEYLVGKHIPLFLVAVLVVLFLFLPYTLLLLFGQWLQAMSHLRLFSWVNSARLKPFMDSYHAPYKPKHRYWPGLLLVLRSILLLAFALNPQQDPSVNLISILVGAGILQLWAWISGGIYKNWCLDALEGSFTLNMMVLGVATYHVQLSGGNQLKVGHTSVSIAFVTFIGIIVYHVFQQLRHTNLWKWVPKLSLKFRKLKTKQTPTNDPTESINFDKLREPWLEDLLQPTHSSL